MNPERFAYLDGVYGVLNSDLSFEYHDTVLRVRS